MGASSILSFVEEICEGLTSIARTINRQAKQSRQFSSDVQQVLCPENAEALAKIISVPAILAIVPFSLPLTAAVTIVSVEKILSFQQALSRDEKSYTQLIAGIRQEVEVFRQQAKRTQVMRVKKALRHRLIKLRAVEKELEAILQQMQEQKLSPRDLRQVESTLLQLRAHILQCRTDLASLNRLSQ